MIYFPNTNYLDAYNAGFAGQRITKPHNMYMQIAVQTGILSLIAFLVFYMLYFISSIRLYLKNSLSTLEAQIGVGILVGSFAYMISGIVNDSTIAVTPLFWAFNGMGVSIYQLAKKSLKMHNASVVMYRMKSNGIYAS